MRKFKQNKALCALLALLLCAVLCLSACGEVQEQPAPETQGTQQGADSQGTQAQPESEQQTDGTASETEGGESETEGNSEVQTITFTVSVIGSDGNARQGAVVRFYLNGEQATMAATAADGTASADLPADTYTVLIDNILGERYDSTDCKVSPESPALSVRLYELPSAGEQIFAYSAEVDDYVEYNTVNLSEGTYWATLSTGDITYFLFVAQRGGQFRVWADEQLELEIGYYGSTSFVLTESAVQEENNAILLDVYDDMVNNYAFVIGIQTADTALTSCILHVEYVGDRELTEDDVPWTNILPEGELATYQKPAGTVRPFDVTSTKVQAVYNPADGYYHLNSEDGAVILVNLGNNSPYLDALTTVCDNMRLGVYVYDEEGNLLSKDSYNDLIWAYSEVADGGYYPLDATLADMLQTVGGYIGWYDASSPMYLFAEQPLVVPENAWLFACAYVY